MAYIKRFIEDIIIKNSSHYPVIMLTGPRQVGKTTVLKHLMDSTNKDISFVTLDDLNERELAINNPKLFLDIHKPPLIIDEFQYAPNLLSYIKIIVDNLRYESLKDETIKQNGLFYLTGSQKFLSIKNIQESLAGRVLILDMANLSRREIDKEENILFSPTMINKKSKISNVDSLSIYEKIFKGGYPELINNKLDKNTYFASYVQTYIERDIRNLINIKNELKFNNFLIEVAARTGCELNLSSISNDIDVSIPTIKEWISILESTGLIILLKPYYENMIKRIVKSPKIYFMDTGLATYLTHYPNPEVLMNSAYSGQILETYVISEIIKSYLNNNVDINNMYYYRDNSGCEIDLVIKENNNLHPIEIKKSKEVKKDFIKNFSVLKNSKYTLSKGMVISLVSQISYIDENNIVYPISMI